MNDRVQHDPRTKQQIKDLLYSFLYGPVLNQFKNQLEAIITKNTLMIGSGHKSFTYKGVLYSSDESSPPRRLNKLDPRLKQTMDTYLKEVDQLNRHELPYVLGFITQVLNSSDSLQDYLGVLPSSVHRPISNMINTCPCRSINLSNEDVMKLQENNKLAIDMLKQRLVTNLLI